jgi:glutaredoxin 3
LRIVFIELTAMAAVRMYTTQVCPYCTRAKALLKQRGVDQIEEVRIDLDPQQREQMMALTGRRTVPQIFIGETHVGGCDDLVALDRNGGLTPLLQAA